MTTSTLHVVFSSSAAGSLKKALNDAGRKEGVACYADNLSLGPIDPPDSKTRLKWVEQELGYTGFDEVFIEVEKFWKEDLGEDIRKVAWLSRRSAPEYAGFLEWLWRLGEAPCEIVDLTDAKVVVRRKDGTLLGKAHALSLGVLSAQEIVDNSLFDRAELVTPTARTRYHNLWRRLRAENAPLRVVNAESLMSAPVTHFDSLLLSCASDRWLKTARVVGEAMGKQLEDQYLQAGDYILSARVFALVELGALEGRGNLNDIRQSEVRLPASLVREADAGTRS